MTGGTRLRPDQRDLFLTVVDALAAGSVTLRGRMIANGLAINVADVLFQTAASTDRLPGMVGDLLRNLYHVEDAPRLYGDAARLVLMEHHALQVRRADEAEMEAMAASEAHAESRKLRAQAKAEVERVKARAERAQRKAAKQALKAAA